MSNQDEKKTPTETDAELESFTERRNRLYTAIGAVVLPGPDTPEGEELEYLCAGVSAQFLALRGSAYAFKMTGLISDEAAEIIDQSLSLIEVAFRKAVSAGSEGRQPADDSESPTVH